MEARGGVGVGAVVQLGEAPVLLQVGPGRVLGRDDVPRVRPGIGRDHAHPVGEPVVHPVPRARPDPGQPRVDRVRLPGRRVEVDHHRDAGIERRAPQPVHLAEVLGVEPAPVDVPALGDRVRRRAPFARWRHLRPVGVGRTVHPVEKPDVAVPPAQSGPEEGERRFAVVEGPQRLRAVGVQPLVGDLDQADRAVRMLVRPDHLGTDGVQPASRQGEEAGVERGRQRPPLGVSRRVQPGARPHRGRARRVEHRLDPAAR